jgi:hypothetical protein
MRSSTSELLHNHISYLQYCTILFPLLAAQVRRAKYFFTMATAQGKHIKPAGQDQDEAAKELPAREDRDSSEDVDNSKHAIAGRDDAGDSAGNGEEAETHSNSKEQVSDDTTMDAPPLPPEAPPGTVEQDDGWEPIWEESAQAFYFYNRFTGVTQWNNPRVPEASVAGPPGVEPSTSRTNGASVAGGYNPAIHGDYDPNAWYAKSAAASEEQQAQIQGDPAEAYAATAAFNRFTGRFQNPDLKPENFNDESKSRRQLNAFFDVDAAANNHDGRSLKEERSGKKLSKAELKWHKEKRKAKKEEKRRAWLRD